MATTNLTVATKSARATALNTALGGGATIKFYTGTIAATPETSIGAQTLLGTLTGNATAFGDVTSGVLTARAITQDSAADATGTATWARLATSGGTAIADVDVGTSGASINLNSVSIVTGGPISITSFTFTEA